MVKLVALIIITLSSFQSAHASIWCSGNIQTAYIANTGDVIIRSTWRNEYTKLCNLKGSAEVDTVTCSLWYSTVTTSMVNNLPVRLMYNGDQYTCSNLPTYYASPIPAYVMLEKA